MHALKEFINLLYPPVCALCQKPPKSGLGTSGGSELFCNSCSEKMMRSEPPLCQQCGIGIAAAYDAPLKCRQCLAHPRLFLMARAPWQYSGTMQAAIHQLKYAHRWRLGDWLCRDMAAVAEATFPVERIDLVVPVPSHWLRKRLRGFDPTAYLARRVGSALNKPYAPKALKRVHWTPSQTRLTSHKRHQNMKLAFRANPAIVDGQSLLLIDDVLTTGATTEGCCLSLRAAGAKEIFVLSAARTPLN